MNVFVTIIGLVFLLPFILFFVFLFKLLKKSKDSAWTGKIIEKKVNVTEDFDSGDKQNNYILVTEMDGGVKRNIAVSFNLYDDCKVGDRLEKPKGSLIPHKV